MSLSDKRLFLLDMDGTLYLDEELFDGTVDFLAHVKAIGGRYIFLTNNSSKSVTAYIEKMARLGIATDKDDFLTSVDSTIDYLNMHHKNDRIYALGTASFKSQLKSAGFDITDTLDENIQTLVMGFDTELTFKKLEDACILLGKGVNYIAANPDYVCPTWYGYVPDCGSVADMLFNATKRRPHFIGKPQPEMVLSSLAKTGYKKEDAILLGDRV